MGRVEGGYKAWRALVVDRVQNGPVRSPVVVLDGNTGSAKTAILQRLAARPDRASLLRYTDTYLRFVWSLSAAVMITAYGLWAFEIEAARDSAFSAISIVRFVLAVLSYAVDVDGGAAGAPEDIALGDRVLQVLAVSWVACFALGVYL